MKTTLTIVAASALFATTLLLSGCQSESMSDKMKNDKPGMVDAPMMSDDKMMADDKMASDKMMNDGKMADPKMPDKK